MLGIKGGGVISGKASFRFCVLCWQLCFFVNLSLLFNIVTFFCGVVLKGGRLISSFLLACAVTRFTCNQRMKAEDVKLESVLLNRLLMPV